MNRKSRMVMSVVAAAVSQPLSAEAWELTQTPGYAAVMECASENLCVLVSCPDTGKPSLEMMIYEFGRGTGEEIMLRVDNVQFPLALPERGKNDLFRWPLTPAISDALADGKRAEVVIDPGAQGAPISLRGSGKAIKRVLTQCSGTVQPVSRARLTGLSPEVGCETATTTGVVVDRETSRSGDKLVGFRFKDRYGVTYINVDPPGNRAAVQKQLLQMIVPGAKLRIEVHGCGAAARVEVLSAVEAVK